MTITFLDILILFGLMGGAAMGFFQGLIRQAAATLILYISIVVSALFYRNLSRFLVRVTGQLPRTTDVLGFFLIMAVMLVLLLLARHELLSSTRADDRRRQPIWQNIAGMLFGFLNAAILCSIAVIVLRSVVGGEPWAAYAGMQTMLRKGLDRSWMVYAFRPFTQLLLTLIEPWLFGNQLPPLLRNAL